MTKQAFAINRLVQRPGDRFTPALERNTLVITKGVFCAAFGESNMVGVVAMKKLLVVLVGLLGAILAGGANIGF